MALKYEIIVHIDDSGDSSTTGGGGFTGLGSNLGHINGHMYVELRTTDTITGKIVQDIFSGRHRDTYKDDINHTPENEQATSVTLLTQGKLDQPGNGSIEDDSERYEKTNPNSPIYDPTVNHFSHGTEITKADFDNAINRINFLKDYAASSIYDYTIAGGVGLSGNCVDFVQDIYRSSGLSGSVASLFSQAELLQSKFAGIYALIQEKYYVGGNNLLTAKIFISELVDLAKNTWNSAISEIGIISDTLSAAYWKFLDSIAKSLIDPLIIDLSNNGIALDSWQVSNALFDLNGNGTKENTGWTKANGDDAFLVIDKNNDGKINDISEMFGNASIPGFTELAKYDSNKDNLINSLDSQFSLLKLWNDKNANGTVDAGEMTTIAANDNTPLFAFSKVA